MSWIERVWARQDRDIASGRVCPHGLLHPTRFTPMAMHRPGGAYCPERGCMETTAMDIEENALYRMRVGDTPGLFR